MSNRSQNIMKIIMIVIYLILTVTGLILMKMGENTGTISIKEGNFNFTINLISALGFICYIGSFLIFTKLVVMFNLSYIMPICTGIVQIVSLVASYMLFKEQITRQGIIRSNFSNNWNSCNESKE